MSDRRPITLDEWMASLPEDRREAIEARASKELADHRNARAICDALAQAQAKLAEQMGVDAEAVAEMGKQVDRYLIKLRKIVRKMGGRLDVVVRMPGRSPARLGQFHDPWARTIRYASQQAADETVTPPAETT